MHAHHGLDLDDLVLRHAALTGPEANENFDLKLEPLVLGIGRYLAPQLTSDNETY
jgi:hypothetical protein